jgi:uncharacterized membrane protein (UPF0136 family)
MTDNINAALGIGPQQRGAGNPITLDDRTAKAMDRYREGYVYARTINGLGIFIQVVAYVIGCLLALGGLIVYVSMDRELFAIAGGVSGFVSGLLIGVVGYILGVLVQSAGQSMKAHFDSAVNTSHFLNDDQRARVMSLE